MQESSRKIYEINNEFFTAPKRYGALMLVKAGELCCEKDYIIAEHEQHYAEINYVVSGEGIFYVSGVPYHAKEGDYVLLQPGDTHSAKAIGKGVLWFLHISFDFDKEYTDAMAEIRSGVHKMICFYKTPQKNRLYHDDNHLRDPLTAILKEVYSHDTLSELIIWSSLMQTLAIGYRNGICACGCPEGEMKSSSKDNSNASKSDNTIYNVMCYVDDHLMEIDSITGIAEKLGYSSVYLSHLFRDKTGLTLQSFVTHRKIEKGKELIEDGRYSISHIATLLKFDSVQSFSRSFRTVTGVAPTQYRKLKAADKPVYPLK